MRKPETLFEELAFEILGTVETGAKGLYVGKTEALAHITNEVILSDDDRIFHASWDDQKEIIKKKFYSVFPYMKERCKG